MRLTITENRAYLGEVVSWTADVLILTDVSIVRMMIGDESLASVAHYEPGGQFLIHLPGRVLIPTSRVREAIDCSW